MWKQSDIHRSLPMISIDFLDWVLMVATKEWYCFDELLLRIHCCRVSSDPVASDLGTH